MEMEAEPQAHATLNIVNHDAPANSPPVGCQIYASNHILVYELFDHLHRRNCHGWKYRCSPRCIGSEIKGGPLLQEHRELSTGPGDRGQDSVCVGGGGRGMCVFRRHHWCASELLSAYVVQVAIGTGTRT